MQHNPHTQFLRCALSFVILLFISGCFAKNHSESSSWEYQIDYVLARVQEEYPSAMLLDVTIPYIGFRNAFLADSVEITFVDPNNQIIKVDYELSDIEKSFNLSADAGVIDVWGNTSTKEQEDSLIAFKQTSVSPEQALTIAQQHLSNNSVLIGKDVLISLSLRIDEPIREEFNVVSVWIFSVRSNNNGTIKSTVMSIDGNSGKVVQVVETDL